MLEKGGLCRSQLKPASVAFGQQHPRSSVPGARTVEGGGHRTRQWNIYMSLQFVSDAFLLFFFVWTMITRCFIFVMTYIHVFFSLDNPSGQFGGLEVSNVTLTRRWLPSYRCAAKTKCSKTLCFCLHIDVVSLNYIVRNNSRRCWCAFLDSL